MDREKIILSEDERNLIATAINQTVFSGKDAEIVVRIKQEIRENNISSESINLILKIIDPYVLAFSSIKQKLVSEKNIDKKIIIQKDIPNQEI